MKQIMYVKLEQSYVYTVYENHPNDETTNYMICFDGKPIDFVDNLTKAFETIYMLVKISKREIVEIR